MRALRLVLMASSFLLLVCFISVFASVTVSNYLYNYNNIEKFKQEVEAFQNNKNKVDCEIINIIDNQNKRIISIEDSMLDKKESNNGN